MNDTKKIAAEMNQLFQTVQRERLITDADYKAFKIKYMSEDSYVARVEYDMNFVLNLHEFDVLEKALLKLKRYIAERYVVGRN